jgi:hypothetical protein
MTPANIRPFKIDLPQSGLDDLRARLHRTRWAVPAGEEYGFPVSRLHRLVGSASPARCAAPGGARSAPPAPGPN